MRNLPQAKKDEIKGKFSAIDKRPTMAQERKAFSENEKRLRKREDYLEELQRDLALDHTYTDNLDYFRKALGIDE